MSDKRFLYANLLIHCFALAHAAIVVIFKYFELSDEIPLTILTVLMIVLVARLNKFPYDLSAVLALMFCFAGFFIGTKGGEWLNANTSGWIQKQANVLVTFLVTELVGWITYIIAVNIQPKSNVHE